MKKFLKKNRAYIASSLIAISILLVVYFLKGIYPFGQNSIVEADLGQAYIPVFYNVYDIFHSGNSIFWNFCLGAGSNFYGSFVLNALFSPFTLLFGLVARPRIIDYVNILLIIKVVFLGITSIYAYKKIFPKTKEYWYVIFGLLYELSAYICLSYHNIVWLDSLIVFPLFVLSLKKLLDTGDARWYTVTLAIELVLSYYISYMILMAIVFIGTLGAFLYTKKSLRKKVCMKILLCTLVALAISSFAFLPSFTQSSISMRLSNVTTNSSLNNPELYTKLNFYMFASIPIIFYIMNIYRKYKQDKKIAWFWILAFIFAFLGVIVEPINKMWHTGSYSSFPYRYGFIPLFLLNLGALSYLNDVKEKDKTLSKLDIILCILSSVLLVGAITLVIIFAPDITTHQIFIGLYDSKLFFSIFMVFLVITLGVILAISIGSKKLRLTLIYTFTILQVFSCAYFFIGMDNDYITGADHKDEVIKLENEIAEEMDLPRENKIDRFRDTTGTFEENYAYILNVPTISSWIHIITQDQADLHKALGYSTRYTRVQDLGGTLFSDSLFHIKYLFTDSGKELSNEIYDLKETYEGFNLYEKDVIPFGILNDGEVLDGYDDDTFEYQNMLYKKLFDKDGDIIHTAKPKIKIDNDEVTLTFKLSSESECYMYIDGYTIYDITANEAKVTAPTIDAKKNRIYPTYSNNGILNLGTFDKTVSIKFKKYTNTFDESKIHIGYIELNEYRDFIKSMDYETKVQASGNKMQIEVESQKNRYLLLPIEYDSGWSAKVNGKEVKIEKYMINFMNIPIEDGENNIELEFIPPKFKLSLLISISTILLYALAIYLNKKFKLDDKKIIQYIFCILYILVYIVFLYKIYIGSVF